MIIDSYVPETNTPFDTIQKYYFKKENKRLLRTYGNTIYRDYMTFDLISATPDPLKFHNIERKFRTKLIDWLFEVFSVMKCSEETIYLTVYIIDGFLFSFKEKQLENENIQIIGVVALFLASKIEDITPIFMNELKTKICHDKFHEQKLKEFERIISTTIDYRFYPYTTVHFIKTYIHEFTTTNKSNFQTTTQKALIADIETIALYVSKVILHSDEFSSYRSCITSISCLIVGFEVVRSQQQVDQQDQVNLRHWILVLIENSGYDPNDVDNLFLKISDYYTNFNKLFPNNNLTKITKLPY